MTEPWIERLYKAQLSEVERTDPGLAASIREAGGVLLFGTVGSEGYLRPDGTVWLNEAENWTAPSSEDVRYSWRQAEGKDRWSALTLGSRRLPEVAQLLPARPADAPDCSGCGGSGYRGGRPGPGEMVCWDCGGLGWALDSAT